MLPALAHRNAPWLQLHESASSTRAQQAFSSCELKWAMRCFALVVLGWCLYVLDPDTHPSLLTRIAIAREHTKIGRTRAPPVPQLRLPPKETALAMMIDHRGRRSGWTSFDRSRVITGAVLLFFLRVPPSPLPTKSRAKCDHSPLSTKHLEPVLGRMLVMRGRGRRARLAAQHGNSGSEN